MKDINELNERINSTEEIIENLVKKTDEIEKQIRNITDLHIPDYSSSLDTIIKLLNEIQAPSTKDRDIMLLDTINAKLDELPKISQRQFRILLFPETNQGQYYKIVFGRLIPWGLAFMVATYIFITGYKAIEISRYNGTVILSMHYQRAWFYLEHRAKKKMLSAMDEAYDKTADK
jgi:hypothetical protein